MYFSWMIKTGAISVIQLVDPVFPVFIPFHFFYDPYMN